MSLRVLLSVLVLVACAHAPPRVESPPAPAEAVAPAPAPAAEPAAAPAEPVPAEEPEEAAPLPEPEAAQGEPAPAVSEASPPPSAPAPVLTLELRPVKTLSGAVAPKSVALSPDGRWAAVMNLEGMEAWLVDTSTLEIVRHIDFAPFKEAAPGWDYAKKKPIPSYAQKPVEAVFSNDSRHLWMSLHNAASVVVYDLEERDEVPPGVDSYRAMIREASGEKHVWRLPRIPTGKTPKVVEMTADSRYVVVGNWHSGTVTVIDTESLRPVANIQSGASPGFIPRGLAISPDSQTVYVANMRGGTISAIDLGTMRKVREEEVTPNPRHLALSRDGRTLFVSENAGGAVLKYDLPDRQILGRSAVGSQARTIALSHDERILFAVSNEDGKIVALRAADLTPIYDAPFVAPMGVAVSPDDRRLWVTSYTGAGYLTVFDVVVNGAPAPQAMR
ncbi:MAG TPA: hypothetical protein VFG59_01735 [Anaeromyxobacter sp.]|nr:hypothetical protein [Anaeromyxobacter sp.]